MNLVDPRFFKRHAGVGQWIDDGASARAAGAAALVAIRARLGDGNRRAPAGVPAAQSGILRRRDQRLQLIPSGPFTGGDCIQQILLLAIYQARQQVVLTTPYFVPRRSAGGRPAVGCWPGHQGVPILPARNDSFMVRHAGDAFLTELLTAGVEIYRFERGLLHTKSVLVDEQLALVGSVIWIAAASG